MRTSAGEKREIIRLVEESQLPVKRVLAEPEPVGEVFGALSIMSANR